MPHPPKKKLRCFQTLPSTQDYCLEQCRRGEGEGLSVLAYQQTAQRASRGRRWVSSSGCLALSIVLTNAQERVDPAIWAFIGGLGFFDGLVHAVPSARKYLAIKWPNDILLRGKKLGGVLVEIEGRNVVIGMGGNIGSLPDKDMLSRQVACLGDICDTLPSLRDIAFSIVEEVYFWHRRWLKEGFEILRQAWLARSVPVGTKMEIKIGNVRKEGAYQGISKQGYLQLLTCNGREEFMTADVLQIKEQ